MAEPSPEATDEPAGPHPGAERYLGRTMGKYRIDGILGSGGFAWVYKAYDPELEVFVALKVLKPHYAGDAAFEERFRREAATAARLRHPNIVKIYAIGREDDAVYFAMDALADDLSERLAATPVLPEPMVIRIGIDVASAIGYAHREGVIHRDIKPDNILFDHHGNAVVVDFGIARAVSHYARHTRTNLVVGTPQYFSPEQARGHSLDGRSDIYSLGVTLYRAATGVLPFNGDDWYEIAHKHVEDRPARPRFHNASLSRQFERLILQCLEKEPAARYPTGEALLQALAVLTPEQGGTIALRSTPIGAAALSTTPFATTAPGTPPAVIGGVRWSGRRWRRVALGTLGVAAAVGLAAYGVRAFHNNDPRGSAASIPVDMPALVPPPIALGALPRTDSATATPDSGATDETLQAAPGDSARIAPGPPTHAVAATPPHPRARAPATHPVANRPRGQPPRDSARTHTPPSPTIAFGTVQIQATPIGASYTLQSLADGHMIQGRTPLPRPLSLPAGLYAVEISNRFCASYRDTIRVADGGPLQSLHVPLVCGH